MRALFLTCSVILFGLVSVATPVTADPIRFIRDPHIHGDRVVFAYQGDLWIAGVDGTGARRLTTHVGSESRPRFSPDGTQIAFSANWMGNADVYVVSVDGGEPRQLTWFTGGDQVQYWAPDGNGIVITSSRGSDPWGAPLLVVPLDGGLPVPMSMDWAAAGMIKPDGSAVAFTRQGVSTSRRGYRGNRSADIWVQDLASNEITQLTDLDLREFRDHVHDGLPMWGADGRIYFISERTGTFNLWSMNEDGTDPLAVTSFSEGGVRYPSISTDGTRIAFEQDFELWIVDIPGGTARSISIESPVDLRSNIVEWTEFENAANGFSPSPDGQFVAVDARGDIVIVPAEEGIGEMTRVTDSPWRDRFQSWSPDGRYLAYISDQSLEEEVWLYDVETREHTQLTTHESTKNGMTWSPTSDKMAFVAANRLYQVDVPDGTVTELGHNPAGGYSINGFSSDGGWLVYDRNAHNRNRDVYLFDLANRSEHNITVGLSSDRSGTMTPDGSGVVFVSNRSGENQLYLVSLTRQTEDPNDPLVRFRLEEERAARPANADSTDATITVDLQLDGIEQRARALTSESDGVGSYFLSKDGRTVYFTADDGDGPGLFAVGIDGRNRRRITEGSFPGLTPTADRSAIFFRTTGGGGGGRGGGGRGGGNGGVSKMEIPGGSASAVDFSFRVRVDHRADWEQLFEESWRVMKYRFYDPDMHGQDWDAIRAVHKPMLANVATYEDVYDLANKMIGELNASHVGVSGSASRPMPSAYQTQNLGIELESAEGRYRVSHIYRDGPADKEWLDLEVGDFVMAIDGEEVRAGDNYWRILNHLLNDYVTLRVADGAGGAGERELRIATMGSINNLRYAEWVNDNRDYVAQESQGRIAYVHIRSMNQASLAIFEREIAEYWDAEGLVVDIRFNGGGNIDQQLIDILERRPYQFWNSRWGSTTWGRRPFNTIAGPKVMMINHRSGSDSEVTPLGFRDLGLGTIVGNPTAAAVIATGSYGLINGGSIRTPGSLVVQWDPTQPNNFGINLENYGVAPDVWVENSPQDNLQGFDRELKTAVDEALRMVAEGEWQYRGTPPSSRGSGGRSGGNSGGGPGGT